MSNLIGPNTKLFYVTKVGELSFDSNKQAFMSEVNTVFYMEDNMEEFLKENNIDKSQVCELDLPKVVIFFKNTFGRNIESREELLNFLSLTLEKENETIRSKFEDSFKGIYYK